MPKQTIEKQTAINAFKICMDLVQLNKKFIANTRTIDLNSSFKTNQNNVNNKVPVTKQ